MHTQKHNIEVRKRIPPCTALICCGVVNKRMCQQTIANCVSQRLLYVGAHGRNDEEKSYYMPSQGLPHLLEWKPNHDNKHENENDGFEHRLLCCQNRNSRNLFIDN